MADRRKTITLSVQDDFSRQLQQFARLLNESQGELDDFQKSAQRGAGFKGMAESLDHLTTSMMNVWNIGRGVVDTIVTLANEGAQIGKAAASFDKLAGGAENAQRWIEAIKTASRGSVTEFEATNQAIQLMTMGLADSADEAGRFMEIAAITAAINPELGSIENAITNIGLTLANDSWMRLDQLGVDAAKAKGRIEELKKEGYAMTEAFDIAVMEQLEANAEKIGTDVLEIGRNTAEMQANWRQVRENASEFALVISEEISPYLNDAAVAAGQLLEVMTKLATGEWPIDIVINAVVTELTGMGSADLTAALFDAARNLGLWGTPQSHYNPVVDPLTGMPLNQPPPDFYAPWSAMNQPNYAGQPMPFIQPTVPERYVTMEELNAYMESVNGPQGMTGVLPYRGGVNAEKVGVPDVLLPFYASVAGISPQAMGLEAYNPATSFQGPAPGKMDWMRDVMGESSGVWGDIFSGIGTAIDTGFNKGKTSALDFFGMMREKAQEMAAEFENQSVAERFGVDASRFDVDVMSEMNAALRDSEVEATAAAEAMQTFALMTGQATGGTELFDRQMARLTGDLQAGKITAQEYALQVATLSQMDLSAINTVVGGYVTGGMFDEANAYIDNLANMDLTQMQATLDLLKPQEGDTETSVFQTMMDDAAEFEETAKVSSETIRDAYVSSMADVSAQGELSFRGLSITSIEQMEAMREYMMGNFNGVTWWFQSKVMVEDTPITATSLGPVDVGNLPAYAEGGFTGRGSRPFPALLHPNEMVIPLNKLPMNGGGGGAVEVSLFIDGRQVEASVANVKRLKNEAF